MIEKPVSKFGLLGDVGVLKSRIERNVRLAAGTIIAGLYPDGQRSN